MSTYRKYSTLPLRYPNPQIPLFPQKEDLLLSPFPTLCTQLKVKMPQNPRKDGSHLRHRETLTNTISRPNRKRLQHTPLILHESLLSGFKPAFRDEGVGIGEVGCGVEGAVLEDANCCLMDVQPSKKRKAEE